MNAIVLLTTDTTSNHYLFFFSLPFLIAFGAILWISLRYYYWYYIKPIDQESQQILAQYYPYYQNLHGSLAKRFENRVVLFIRSKDFYGMGELIITQEMKVLIAAAAVQITFGFKFYQLPRFKKILVYPTVYYSEQTGKHHKGEVSPFGGIIRLSWNNFLSGFQSPNDGINLGLHEMTHAMSLENKYFGNGDAGFISRTTYQGWLQIAHPEMERIRAGKKSLFRAYAATNAEEFLSVSVEVFFEQTQAFKNYHPQLFLATCKMLNQYPTY